MKTTKEALPVADGDVALLEMWQIKDEMSAARRHNIDKLFADLRERQSKSGHAIVNFEAKNRKT